jgi:serine/threonine-protein kinase
LTLTPGTRLGPYEVVALLGVGGMGEVYRATDTNLKRQVAIKVLPAEVAADADRLARFQREAEVLAALNHPNIAQIFGLEKSDGTVALVMELVEGPTLADRIAVQPIPIAEALPIAKQIAEALEAAHEQGIVHRDLKPANIKVRPDGTAKLLDYGLAKAMEPAGAMSASVSMSPTITTPAMMTGGGMILGTAAYMSPEQARGKTVDRRADIWAFGCVLYEMLTGRRAFEDEDVSLTLSKVLQREPDFAALPAEVPAHVQQTVRLCLRKPLKERIPDIAAARLALEGAFESPSSQADARLLESADRVGARRSLFFIAGAALMVGAGAAAGITWVVTRPAPVRLQPMRFAIVLSAAQQFAVSTTDRQLALSPDGTHLAYIALEGQLMVRAIDQLDAEPVRGIAHARTPFWSPDSKWIGFVTGDNKMMKVPVTGGPSVTVCGTNGAPRGASWGEDDTIVFATSDPATGLQSISASGGEPRVLTRPDHAHGEVGHLFPVVLRGGNAVLFTIAGASTDQSQVAALDLKSGARKIFLRGSQADYIETGHLVYAFDGTLWAVRFDSDRLDVSGEPIPVVERVTIVSSGAAQYSLSRTGALVYLAGSAAGGTRSLVWVDRNGREEPTNAPARLYTYARLSPDGTRAAVEIVEKTNDIWIWDFARATLGRLTFGPATNTQPIWTPDGRRIIFPSTRSGVSNLFWQPADGTGTAERLTTSPQRELNPSISADGKQIVMLEQFLHTGNDLTLFHVDGKSPPEPLLSTPFSEARPEISPDGRWLAYNSNEAGREEVYVRPFPDVQSGHWQVSVDGGTRPAWARSGKELFFGTPDGSIVAVPVQTSSSFSYGGPKKLFEWRTLASPGLARSYDVSADGQRFLMIKEGGGDPASAATPLVLVLNWSEELKQRVPTK